jgi:hypothetical protein
MVPQRVDPERQAIDVAPSLRGSKGTTGYTTSGASDFVEAIDTSPEEYRDDLRRLSDWAIALEQQGIARLFTYHGKEMINLLPWLLDEKAGLVTIYNNRTLSVWRTVFERRAPKSISRVETAIGTRIGSGNSVRVFDDEVLSALTEAYREAAEGSTRSVLVADESTTPKAH